MTQSNVLRDWHDLPVTDTPINQAALEDLEARSIRSFLDARKWVGFTSSASDKGALLQQALDAARDEGPGATLILPPWVVTTAQELHYDNYVSVRGHGMDV